jgi:hypothetical protein
MKTFAKMSGVMICGPLLAQVVDEVNTSMLFWKIRHFCHILCLFSNPEWVRNRFASSADDSLRENGKNNRDQLGHRPQIIPEVFNNWS